LDGTGLASHSVAVATMLLLHIILTKSMICGMEINKNQPQPGKIPCEGEAYKSSNSLNSGIG
jgi:hypothetical protein